MSPSFTSKLTFTKMGSPSGLKQARFFTAIRGAMALRVQPQDTKIHLMLDSVAILTQRSELPTRGRVVMYALV